MVEEEEERGGGADDGDGAAGDGAQVQAHAHLCMGRCGGYKGPQERGARTINLVWSRTNCQYACVPSKRYQGLSVGMWRCARRLCSKAVMGPYSYTQWRGCFSPWSVGQLRARGEGGEDDGQMPRSDGAQ